MKKGGWFKEPWRHSLSAKGVKTNYYSSKSRFRYFQDQTLAPQPMSSAEKIVQEANLLKEAAKERFGGAESKSDQRARSQFERPKSKVTEEKELRAAARIEEFKAQQLKASMPVEQALNAIKNGQTRIVVNGQSLSVAAIASNPSLAPQDRARLRAAVNERAILLVQAEERIPPEYEGVLTDTTKAQIKAIQQQQKISARSPAEQALIQTGKGALIGAEEALAGAGEKVVEAPGKLLKDAKEGLREAPSVSGGRLPSLFGDSDAEKAKGESLFFGQNPLLGGPSLTSGGGNIALGDDPRKQKVDQYPEAKVVKKEIDELFGAKDRLKKVDLSSFQKGKEAFKKGDREKLISSINDLESQEQNLRDRWSLIEQTRSVLLNPRTRAATLRKEEGGILGASGLFGGSSGGSAIADQTMKLNELKRDVKDAANEAFARRVDLQNDLRRMDAKVQPVTDAPSDVKVFKDDARERGWLSEVARNNPALKETKRL